MNFEPVNNGVPIVRGIVKQLTDRIVQGELLPGEKIPPEGVLCEQFGVSRNSLREAVKMLCAIGVLEVQRGQGTYVASVITPDVFNPLLFSMILRPKKADDLYELRIMFEGMVIMLLMDKMNESDMEQVDNFLRNTETTHESGGHDFDFFVRADLEFHQMMLQATHNPLIERIGQTITELFVTMIQKSLKTPGGIEDSIRNHRRILKVIREKNREQVFRLVGETLSRWRQQSP